MKLFGTCSDHKLVGETLWGPVMTINWLVKLFGTCTDHKQVGETVWGPVLTINWLVKLVGGPVLKGC